MFEQVRTLAGWGVDVGPLAGVDLRLVLDEGGVAHLPPGAPAAVLRPAVIGGLGVSSVPACVELAGSGRPLCVGELAGSSQVSLCEVCQSMWAPWSAFADSLVAGRTYALVGAFAGAVLKLAALESVVEDLRFLRERYMASLMRSRLNEAVQVADYPRERAEQWLACFADEAPVRGEKEPAAWVSAKDSFAELGEPGCSWSRDELDGWARVQVAAFQTQGQEVAARLRAGFEELNPGGLPPTRAEREAARRAEEERSAGHAQAYHEASQRLLGDALGEL